METINDGFTVIKVYKRHMTPEEAEKLALKWRLSPKVVDFIKGVFTKAKEWEAGEIALYHEDFDIECNVGDDGRLGLGMGWEGEWDGLSEAMDIDPIPREAGDPRYLEVDKVFSLFFQE